MRLLNRSRSILVFAVAATLILLLPLHSQTAASSEQSGTPLSPASPAKAPAPSVRPVASRSSAKSPTLRQISILPASITLDGPSASQRLLVEGVFEDGRMEICLNVGDLADEREATGR